MLIIEKRNSSIVSVHEVQGNVAHHYLADRFDNKTAVGSVRIKGRPSKTVNHGPGKVSRDLRPSAKRVERGRAGVIV